MLLTRAPLYRGRSPFSHDLHVLGAPLTFVLSQDQTLQFESFGRHCGAKPSAALMLALHCVGSGGRSSTVRLPTRFLVCNQTQFSRTEGSVFSPVRGRGT